MTTYVLAEYEQEDYNKEVRPPARGAGPGVGAHGWARLSPFNMPDQVTVVVDPDGGVRFVFGYPNDEPALDRPVPVTDDLDLCVGRFSGKVLEARIRNALARFRAGTFTFDPCVADRWATGLPADRQFACRRNAEVVSMIVRTMPQDARRWVVAQLRGSLASADRPSEAPERR